MRISALVVVMLSLTCVVAEAANPGDLWQKRNGYEQRIDGLQADLERYQEKLTDAEQDLREAQQDLSRAEASVAKAQQADSQDSSLASGRALKDARQDLKVAELSIAGKERRVERYRKRIEVMEEKMAALQGRLAALQGQIAQQDKVTATAPSPEAEPEPQVPAAVVAEAQLTALDEENLELVREEQARLQEMLEDGKGKRPLRSVKLEGGSLKQDIELDFVGARYYRGEFVATAGEQKFEVRSKRFVRTIPPQDNGEVYEVLVNFRRLDRPRLTLYKQSLLQHL